MGCWALPHTKKAAKEIRSILRAPTAPALAIQKMWNVYGDDILMDDLGDLNAKDDARPIIVRHLRSLLKRYKQYPEDFTNKLSPSIIESIESSIKGWVKGKAK